VTIRFPYESVVSIDHLDEPALIVDCDGVIQGMNRLASAVILDADILPSFFVDCRQSPETLRQYLACCSDSRQPALERIPFAGRAGPIDLRHLGNVLVPNWQDKPTTIVLRLLSGPDTRFSAGAECTRSLTADRRSQLGSELSDELRADKLRLVEQYLFIAEALRLAERRKRELEDELARVRVEEREHIAQDLHDQAGQELAAAIAEIRLIRDSGSSDNADRLDALADQLADVGRRLYRTVKSSRPRIVEELGLVKAIEATVTAYAGDGGLKAAFSRVGMEPASVPAMVECAIYRVAQEALTNVLKHAAGARTIEARIAFTENAIALKISDDGAGMPVPFEGPCGEAQDSGLGLKGMRQRMCGIGGTLEIVSTVGEGTTITAIASLVAEPMGIPPR